MSASAAIVTGNETNAINGAINEMLTAAPRAAEVRFSLLVARAADKTANGRLWNCMLALAGAGAAPDQVRAAGAGVRKAVARLLRVAAGFPADKAKGSKESGAPDYSTASVYASVIAGCMEAMRDDRNTFDAACAACTPDNGILELDDETGIPATKGAAARVLKDYQERRAAALAASLPALQSLYTAETRDSALARVTVERDALAEQVAALRKEVAALLGARPAQEGLPAKGAALAA